MRRHSVLARLGPTDKSRIRICERKSVSTKIHFVDDQGQLLFGIGKTIQELQERGIYPNDVALDLTLLAATVTVADTRISRKTESQDGWTREMDLYVPVKNPNLWNDACPLIERMLKFLTGDHWRLFFRKRHSDYRKLLKWSKGLLTAQFDGVSLFSGGLDSFVGAIDLLEKEKNSLFVSHYWDPSTSKFQKACMQKLESRYGEMVSRHVSMRLGFSRDLVQGSKPENTTRGRSFLFFALAALAASGLPDDTTIYVPENGFISLNIPIDPLRIGALSTRTTHPFYMLRWEDLTQHLRLNVKWKNPYRFRTKGEMLSKCKNRNFLQKHINETVSCSSITKARWQRLSARHCGHCVPCIIRRAAIMCAFGEDVGQYTVSLHGRPLNSEKAEGIDVRSFQIMARRMTKHPKLAKVLIHKSGSLSDYTEKEIESYARVFSRGIKEVSSIVKDVEVRPL